MSPHHPDGSASRRALRLLLGALVAQMALVLPNEGEFWPASIYPMFSQAGRSWRRAHVRDVTGLPASDSWVTRSHAELPGAPLAVETLGINQNDLANLVGKTRDWSAPQKAALARLLASERPERELLVYRVSGRLLAGGEVEVAYEPVAIVDHGQVRLRPELQAEGR